MSGFLKCECPHCGQSIEYPSKGTGETVPCPTCEKPITLTPKGQPSCISRIPAEEERSAALEQIRSEPATKKQKEKLRWFGCAFDENLSKGQAKDMLDKCVSEFPEKNAAYYSRPATKEQITELKKYLGKDLNEDDEPYTYEDAKHLIRMEERKFAFSEAGEIAVFVEGINTFRDQYRKVTKAEVTKAWELVKSRKKDTSKSPNEYEIVDALLELFSDYRASYNGNQRDWSFSSKDFNEVAQGSKQNVKFEHPTREQMKAITGSGFTIDADAPISADQLDALLKLEGKPPRFEDVELLTKHGITLQTGDAFAVYALALLANQFEKLTPKKNREYKDLVGACSAATSDPEYYKAMVTIGNNGGIIFSWRMDKMKQWYRDRAEF